MLDLHSVYVRSCCESVRELLRHHPGQKLRQQMIGDTVKWRPLDCHPVNKLHQVIYMLHHAHRKPDFPTALNHNHESKASPATREPNTLAIPTRQLNYSYNQSRPTSPKRMCRETRWTYKGCYHSGGRRFEYCGFATSTNDLKIQGLSGPPRQIMCTLPETIDREAPGYCPTCRERMYKAKNEATAARDRGWR